MLPRRHLPLSAWALLGLAAYVLLAGATATQSATRMVGMPTIGVLLRWWGPLQCNAVAETNPPSWLLLGGYRLQPGDCVGIDGAANGEAALAQSLAAPLPTRFVSLLIRRGEQRFRVPDQFVSALTMSQVLQIQLPLTLTALTCWMLALVALLAQPRAEANRVLAGLFFLLALAVVSLNHRMEWLGRNIFNLATIYLALSLVGATAIHLALVFPLRLRRWPWLRCAAYAPAGVSLLLHAHSVLPLSLGPLDALNSSVAPFLIDGVLWSLAFPLLIGRLLWTLRSSCPAQLAAQVRILLASWSIGFLPPTLASSIALISLRWVLPGTSLMTFLFFLPIAVAGSAYAMLRFQSFAYRGRVLPALTIVFVTTALACLITLVLAISVGAADGLQFLAIWAGVLLATLFWFVDTPLRRLFRSHFLRHQDSYRTAYEFAAQIALMPSSEQTLHRAAALLTEAFQAEWSAAWSPLGAGYGVAIDSAGAPHNMTPATLPSAPALAQPLGAEAEAGWIWVGPRSTGEPFDQDDTQLLALLGDYLTPQLLLYEQIRRLSEVPSLLIAAEDRERQRLGVELHDRALGYLGGLPLMLGRARRLAQAEPAEEIDRIYAWIEQHGARVSDDLRTIITQLSPQDLSGAHFLPATRAMASRLCDLYGIPLRWEVTGTWGDFSAADAIQLYRVIEQAMSNALQHARPAVVTVALLEEMAQRTVIVRDDGNGFDIAMPAQPGHVGLESMRERARLLGGTIEIASAPGSGTRVSLRLSGDPQTRPSQRPGALDRVQPPAPSLIQAKQPQRRWPAEALSLFVLVVCIAVAAFASALAHSSNCSERSGSQRISVSGQDAWKSTGICLNPGQRVTLLALDGSWTANRNNLAKDPFVGPEGYSGRYHDWTVFQQAQYGALIGKVGESEVFAVGKETTVDVHAKGELQLRMNDSSCGGCADDNAGSVDVMIVVEEP